MSVVNIILRDSDVRIVCDTCTYDQKQPVQWNRKITVRPGPRIALAVRGRHWIGVGLQAVADQWGNYDQAVAGVLGSIPLIMEQGRDVGESFEVTIAGWQDGPKVTRIFHRVAEKRRPAETKRYEFEPGFYLTPSLGKHDLPVDVGDTQICNVARVQQEMSRKKNLNLCIGGDIELTTITAEGAEIAKIGEYADKQLMDRRIARATPDMRARAAA